MKYLNIIVTIADLAIASHFTTKRQAPQGDRTLDCDKCVPSTVFYSYIFNTKTTCRCTTSDGAEVECNNKAKPAAQPTEGQLPEPPRVNGAKPAADPTQNSPSEPSQNGRIGARPQWA